VGEQMRVIIRLIAANSAEEMINQLSLWVLIFDLNKSKMRGKYSSLHNYLTLLIEPPTISDRIDLYLAVDAIALRCPPILKTSTTNRKTIKEVK
jgi:hypothetical protein